MSIENSNDMSYRIRNELAVSDIQARLNSIIGPRSKQFTGTPTLHNHSQE
jgi:hypothetical protein